LANFVMLTSASNKKISDEAPSAYLQVVRTEAGTHLPEWLSSNLLTEACFEAGLANEFDRFLELRAKKIHDAVWAKTGW
jgi:hypothetical protein